MSKIGKILPIPKEHPDGTLGSALKQKGYQRFPGTKISLTPYKEIGGKYRTGLDPDAPYLNNLSAEDKAIEVARIEADFERLSKEVPFDLSSKSEFYKYNSNKPEDEKVHRVVLGPQGVTLDLEDPMQEIAFHWLKVHPAIAPSLEKYRRGEAFSGAQFYVENSNEEVKLEYKRVHAINKAIAAFDALTPSDKRQVCRLMGLFADSRTGEEEMYTKMVAKLNDTTTSSKLADGGSSVELLNSILNLNPDLLKIKDLVAQAIQHGVWYTKRDGSIYEGENRIGESRQDLESRLSIAANQDEVLALESKLRIKLSYI